MDSGAKINWTDEESHLLLNSRMLEDEKEELRHLHAQFARKSHIWIASSGSSKSAGQSLKLIALSKEAFLASAKAVNTHLESSKEDVWLQTLPRFHVGGLSIETRAFLSGAKIVSQNNWSAEEFIAQIQSQHVTLSSLVPTQVYDLIQTGQKAPSSLRAIVIGGAALSENLYREAIGLDWPLLPSYGMTECCSQIATASLNTWKSGDRALQILSHVRARTTDENVLEVSSPALLTGFAQRVDGKAIWQDPKVAGWYRSQDLVRVENGILTPMGRNSDFVKISGEGVDLQRLRELLEKIAQRSLPGAWQSLNLMAVPDERRGHILVLQALEGTIADPIRDLFNQQVAPFERIQEIRSVRELPWKKRAPQSW